MSLGVMENPDVNDKLPGKAESDVCRRQILTCVADLPPYWAVRRYTLGGTPLLSTQTSFSQVFFLFRNQHGLTD